MIQCSDEVSHYVRRRSDEEFSPQCVAQTVKHPTQVMIWSCLSVYGTGRLYIVNGNMRQDQYKSVLEDRLLPQMREWALKQGLEGLGDFIFMHDGAPCHKGKTVTKFLKDNGVRVLPWPGNSPDMNPIENLWAILKKRMKKENICNKTELIAKLISVWHRDEEIKAFCETLTDSMPRRISALIKAKGSFTKY